MSNFAGIAIPTFVAGSKARAADLATMASLATALTDGWTTWTPTYTNLTIGSGTVMAIYKQIGKTVDWYWSFVFGSGSAVGSIPTFTLPVAASASYPANSTFGWVAIADVGVSGYAGTCILVSSTTAKVNAFGAAGTYANTTDLTATVPFTWNSTDTMSAGGRYQAA